MLFLAGCLAATYFALIAYFLRHWHRLPAWHLPKAFSPVTRVSVIIPARNEAGRIEACLRSLAVQAYPGELTEIIVVDDHSTDDTALAVSAMALPQVKMLHLADHVQGGSGTAYKKMALALGIAHSTGELIVTTDADCRMGPHWLSLLVAGYEARRPVFLGGPVVIDAPRTPLERFQALDLQGMALITGAGHQAGTLMLANGANMAFTRRAFEAVGGYQGIDHLASGDDLLLLEKLQRRFPGRTCFIKNREAAVWTDPMPDWPAFLAQRLRWASKTSAYRDQTSTWIWSVVFLNTVALLASLFLLPWKWPLFWQPALVLLMGKIMADYWLLRTATRFFRQPGLLRSFWEGQAIHLVYVPWVGIQSLFRKTYHWKGRRTR